MSAEKNVEKSFTVCKLAPQSALFLAEFIGHLPLIWPVVCVCNNRLQSRYGADIEEKHLLDVDDQNASILA